MEIPIKEARGKISYLLNRAIDGEEIIITKRGKRAARLVPIANEGKSLPGMAEFRDSIKVKGEPLSSAVVQARQEERY